MRFERTETGWKTTEPFVGTVQLDDVMNMVVGSIAKITATGFADTVDAVTAGLEPPVRTIEIQTKAGSEHFVEIGLENPARQTFTRIRGDEQIYLVPVGRWNTVFRKAGDVAAPDEEDPSDVGATEAGAATGVAGESSP